MKNILLIFLFILPVLPFQSYAQDSGNPFSAKLLFEAGAEFGGDEILTIFFTGGGDQTMRAGQGGYLSVGGEFQLTRLEKFILRASVGIKYNTTAADNANIRLTRLPINLMGFWKITDDIRAGAGITTHQNAQLKGDGFFPDVKFTSSLGPRFEVGYKWIAVTYTVVNYVDDFDISYSASSFGVALSFTYPN